MINIYTCRASDIPALAASQASVLCWDDSQMQLVFKRLAASLSIDTDREMVISYATGKQDNSICVIGWASLGLWYYKGMLRHEVQAYVHPTHRHKGLGFALVACCTHDLNSNKPIAVFSDECYNIAKRLRWDVEQYKSDGDEWVQVLKSDFRLNPPKAT